MVRASFASAGELGGEPLAWQLVAISQQAGPCDLAGDPVSEGMNAGRGRAGLGRLRGSRARQERERHPVDVGVLGLEFRLVVGGVAHPPKGAADDLLAEQLRAEGPDAENVGHGAGVPSLGQHRDAHDATDLLAELAGLADGVHHFAEQVFVGQILGVAAREPGAVLGLELVDLQGGDLLELGAHRIARFQLLAVDQDRERSGFPSPVFDVAEKGKLAGNRNRRAVREGSLPSADVVEDQLRDVGVVADDDEDGRSLVAGPFRLALLPLAVAGFIVAVEAMESPLQLDRQLGLASDRLGSSALAGKFLPDSRPEVAVGRLLPLHRVVGDGNAGNLDDARLDGVDEREVGDDPGEEVPFPIARAAEEEGGRRQVVEAADADLVADGFQPRDPDPGFLVPLLGFGAVFPLERLGLAVGLAPVAVMGLVVDDDDVPLAAELPANAVDHLGGALVEVGAENLLGQLVRLDQLADLERVEVGDEDLGPAELPDQVGRDQVAEPVVVLGVVGPEHPQPVADGDARSDDEERVGEPAILRVGDLVQGVPGDEHGHDDRLARAGRHLHRDAIEPRVRCCVGLPEPGLDPVVADLLGGFGQDR